MKRAYIVFYNWPGASSQLLHVEIKARCPAEARAKLKRMKAKETGAEPLVTGCVLKSRTTFK